MVVYKLTNPANGKVYVGSTMHAVEKRIAGHDGGVGEAGTKFYRELHKDGLLASDLVLEILESIEYDNTKTRLENIRELHKLETKHIQDHFSRLGKDKMYNTWTKATGGVNLLPELGFYYKWNGALYGNYGRLYHALRKIHPNIAFSEVIESAPGNVIRVYYRRHSTTPIRLLRTDFVIGAVVTEDIPIPSPDEVVPKSVHPDSDRILPFCYKWRYFAYNTYGKLHKAMSKVYPGISYEDVVNNVDRNIKEEVREGWLVKILCDDFLVGDEAEEPTDSVADKSTEVPSTTKVTVIPADADKVLPVSYIWRRFACRTYRRLYEVMLREYPGISYEQMVYSVPSNIVEPSSNSKIQILREDFVFEAVPTKSLEEDDTYTNTTGLPAEAFNEFVVEGDYEVVGDEVIPCKYYYQWKGRSYYNYASLYDDVSAEYILVTYETVVKRISDHISQEYYDENGVLVRILSKELPGFDNVDLGLDI